MLKILQNKTNIVPVKYNFDISDNFHPGQIAHFESMQSNVVRRCYVNPPHFSQQYFNSNSDLCGIIDDVYDLSMGTSSCTNGYVTVWPFVSGMIIETDMYEATRTYWPGDYLYVSWNGCFGPQSNCPYPGQMPIIAEVLQPPINAGNIVLTLFSLPAKQPITQSNNNMLTTGAVGSFITVSPGNSITYSVPCGDDIKKEEFCGIKMPNGSIGSQCLKCGCFNNYIIDKNYICYNCKVEF